MRFVDNLSKMFMERVNLIQIEQFLDLEQGTGLQYDDSDIWVMGVISAYKQIILSALIWTAF